MPGWIVPHADKGKHEHTRAFFFKIYYIVLFGHFTLFFDYISSITFSYTKISIIFALIDQNFFAGLFYKSFGDRKVFLNLIKISNTYPTVELSILLPSLVAGSVAHAATIQHLATHTWGNITNIKLYLFILSRLKLIAVIQAAGWVFSSETHNMCRQPCARV